MKKEFVYKLVLVCIMWAISMPAFPQYYGNSPKRNAASFGGKNLVNNNFTVGGVRVNEIQPRYGGQIVDERDLYNPYLESAFRYMGKPLVSHHPPPFSGSREINPGKQNLTPQTTTSYQPFVNNAPMSSQDMQIPNKKNTNKESEGLTPIIPVVVGTVDAMFRNSQEEKSNNLSKTKRLSLDGWNGYIQRTGNNRGNFHVRSSAGDYISGNFYKSGNHIDYNITHNSKEGFNSWRGDIYQYNSGGSLSFRNSQNLISGSATSYGDTYRYRFNDRKNKYEVEVRDMGKSSQSIRVNENNSNYIYGYAN